jgi:hypothetical protein
VAPARSAGRLVPPQVDQPVGLRIGCVPIAGRHAALDGAEKSIADRRYGLEIRVRGVEP